MIMKNKHGAVEVVLLVLLVVVLVSATIFSFAISSKSIKITISDSSFMEELYLKENLAEFYIRQAGEEAIVKTYDELGDSYTNEDFKTSFRENFRVEARRYIYEEPYTFMNNLRILINKGEFGTSLEENTISVSIDSYKIEDSFKNISMVYFPRIDVSFDLEKYEK